MKPFLVHVIHRTRGPPLYFNWCQPTPITTNKKEETDFLARVSEHYVSPGRVSLCYWHSQVKMKVQALLQGRPRIAIALESKTAEAEQHGGHRWLFSRALVL